jgi:hypothetical protein
MSENKKIELTQEVSDKLFKQPENMTLSLLVLYALAKLGALSRELSVHSTKLESYLRQCLFVDRDTERPFSLLVIRESLKRLASLDLIGWASETTYRRGSKRGRRRSGGAFISAFGRKFAQTALVKHLQFVERLAAEDAATAASEVPLAVTQVLATSAAPAPDVTKTFAGKSVKRQLGKPDAAPPAIAPTESAPDAIVCRRPDGVEYRFASAEVAAEFDRLSRR